MEKFIYVNATGASIEFGNQPPFVLSSIEGLGDVEGDIQTRKSPYQDGESFVRTHLIPRILDIEITIIKDVVNRRRQLAKVFNPKLTGTLYYESDGIRRKLDVQSEHVPKFLTKRGPNYQVVSIGLKAANPYWLDDQESRHVLASADTVIANQGDVDSPIRLEIKGPAQTVRVINRSTNQTILINRALSAGDTLVITTGFGEKKVTLNGANAFHYVDMNSVFWSLRQGNNTVRSEGAQVTLYYQSRYVSV